MVILFVFKKRFVRYSTYPECIRAFRVYTFLPFFSDPSAKLYADSGDSWRKTKHSHNFPFFLLQNENIML